VQELTVSARNGLRGATGRADPGRAASPRVRAPRSDLAGPEEDATLAARAKRGDRIAFARLYERFASAVHGVLLAAAPREDAADLVQEVFLLALRAIARLEEPRSIGPWLLTIARNRARDAHKARRAVGELNEEVEGVEDRPTDDGAGDGDEVEARRALAAVRSLPDAYRETLILRLVEGLTGPEIAARTGLTHGSVRVNLHRGMKLLRERLARGGGG
jgi:RNA polymerase sigma-70 factor (ECF subfamily)